MQKQTRANRPTVRFPSRANDPAQPAKASSAFAITLGATLSGFAAHAYLAICAEDGRTPEEWLEHMIRESISSSLSWIGEDINAGKPLPGGLQCEVRA